MGLWWKIAYDLLCRRSTNKHSFFRDHLKDKILLLFISKKLAVVIFDSDQILHNLLFSGQKILLKDIVRTI